jgi:hydroxyethylthiazole kinase-like uncharacterized protein yjeF
LQEKFFRVTLSDASDPPQAKNFNLVVDGLFGIGLARPIEAAYAKLVAYVNAQACPVLALDIPSGLNSDTGQVLGCAVRASHTVTFIGLKPGLLTLDGPDHCGQVSVADLGLHESLDKKASGWVAEPTLFAGALKQRARNFHKGMAGSLGVIGGAAGMAGAALLAGRAALKMGAGRVYGGLLEEHALDPRAPELMLRHPDDVLGLDLNAIVIGPGLGQGERAETLLGAVLASELPCVLDADALNLIAENEDLRRTCARRSAETLLTPHPAEAARLLAESTDRVQADRLKAARALSANLNAHVVLKGNGSIIVARDGHWFINTSGNPGMASAGMGDVLSGILGALLAQKYTGETSLVLGTHLHGCAADECVRAGAGPVGLTAGELIDPARRLWNSWTRDSKTSRSGSFPG